jgi:tetratricopeptide (TPR) repeat protein
MDTVPFLITITFGDLTGGLDDVNTALASVDAKSDIILIKNPEALTGLIAHVIRNGAVAARALDAANIRHTRRELLFVPGDDEAALGRLKQALFDAGVTVNLEFHLTVEPQAYALGVDRLAQAREVYRKLGVLEGKSAAPTTGLSTPVMADGTHVMPDTPQPEPTTVDGYIRRGTMRGSRGDPEGSMADFDSALRLDPKSADAFAGRGYTRENLADLAGAVDDYSEAIRLKPEFVGVYGNRGDARLKMGDLAGALADYDHVIQLDPKSVICYTNRGNVRARMGDLAGAIEDISEAIRLNPKFAIGYFNRGKMKQDQGDLAGAIDDYDEAIRLEPEFVGAYANRGHMRAQLGDEVGAEADFQKHLELLGKK